jgi:hypothetical protein
MKTVDYYLTQELTSFSVFILLFFLIRKTGLFMEYVLQLLEKN